MEFVFNVAKGKVAQLAEDETLKLLVLKSSGTEAALKDLDTVAAVLAEGSTTEADFDNYARATLAGVSVVTDDTGDVNNVDADDVTFTAAGGTTDNTTTDAIVYADIDGTDGNAIPLTCGSAVFTTDGNDVTLQVHASGFFGAS